MAKIPIIGIPEAPKGDAVYLGQAAGGQISAPGVKYQEAINFERHIPGLMQPELSRRPYDALAGAQSDIGSAIARTGQVAAATTAAFLEGMQDSKDAADVSRATLQMRTLQASYEQEVAEKQIPVSQRLALWDSKYAPQAAEGFKAMKMSPHVAERVGPEWGIFNARTRTGIIHKANKEQIENDRQAIENDFTAALQAGDWEAAVDANARLTEGRHQTIEQAKARGLDIAAARQEFDLNEDLGNHPRAVLEEMREIQRTGKSDVYSSLKNPAIVNRYANLAREEVNRREVDAEHAVANGIITGEVKRPEDIERIAQGNIEPRRVAALKKQLLIDPPYDAESVTKIKTAIEAYDPQGDYDMAKYFAITEAIGTTVPKDLQGKLKAELYQTATEARDGKFKSPQQRFTASLMEQIQEFADKGFFDPPGYDRERAKKDPKYFLKHRETEQKIWTEVETYKELMREWLKGKPDATPEDANKQLGKIVGDKLRASAAKAFAPPWTRDSGEDILPPAARDKLKPRLTPEEIRRRLSPRYEFGEGMAKVEGDDAMSTASAINDDLISAVKSFEGYASESQWDFKQWSVGYGTKGSKGESITPQQAEARLRSELAMHAGKIDAAAADVKLTLTPGQRNALISFDFNTGKGAQLIRTSNGDTDEILRRLKLYVKAGGKTLPGLVNRRNAEAEMFLT